MPTTVIELELEEPDSYEFETAIQVPAVAVGTIQYIKRNNVILPIENYSVNIEVPDCIHVKFADYDNKIVANYTIQAIRNAFNANGFVLGIYKDRIYELNDIQSGYYKFVNMDDEIIRTITYSDVTLSYKEIDYKCKINWGTF